MRQVELMIDNENKKISWNYKRGISKMFVNKIMNAFYSELDGNVHICLGECGEDEYVIYKIDGEMICDVNFLNNTYIFFSRKGKILTDLISAIYDHHNNCLLFLVKDVKAYYIQFIGMEEDGMIEVPHNIVPEYLIQMKAGPTLVGDSEDVDAYGRYRWNYTIDYQENNIKRRCLAY